MQQMMRDPAAGVPRELLPHLHLVSKYRFPTLNHLSLDAVVGYLTEAPKIVHDLQPVVWQFVEAPADGTVFLVWQPLDYVGTNFASDGYVWGDAEQAFTSDHNGYVVEMYLHRGGFHWPNELYTAHSRKRYRITQAKAPNAPPFDHSLWIIHYTRAERENVVLASQLPVQPTVQASLNQRRFLQSQGHLARKEFMLHDKANWPTIHIPSGPGAQALPYAPHVIARQQAGAAPMQSSASPARNASDRIQHRRAPSNVLDPSLEEEEDVSRGDLLDFMTPRDISKMRYEQHHEWMEEIMSSPYAMKQIMPTDLGLGRKGELEALTGGFFDPPTSVLQETSANASNVQVGRMEVGKAEEFTARAAQKVADMEAELDNLKKRHARRMAKLDKSSSLMAAEKRLRSAPVADGRKSMFDNVNGGTGSGPRSTVDDVAGEVQDAVGKKMIPVSAVECVQKGGLEVKVNSPQADATAEPKGVASPGLNETSPDASTPNVLGVLPEGEQTETPPPPPQITTASSISEHLSSQLPALGDDNEVSAATIKDMEMEIETPAVPSLVDMDVDVEMAGLDNEDRPAEDQAEDNDGSEWVMVNDVAATGVESGETTTVPPAKASPLDDVVTTPQRDTTTTAGTATATATSITTMIDDTTAAPAPSTPAPVDPGVSAGVGAGAGMSTSIPGLSLDKPTANTNTPPPQQAPPPPPPQPAVAATVPATSTTLPPPLSSTPSSSQPPNLPNTTTDGGDFDLVQATATAPTPAPNLIPPAAAAATADDDDTTTAAGLMNLSRDEGQTQAQAQAQAQADSGVSGGQAQAQVQAQGESVQPDLKIEHDPDLDMGMGMGMEMEMDVGMDVGMDDSAFGEAFHPPDEEEEDEEGGRGGGGGGGGV